MEYDCNITKTAWRKENAHYDKHIANGPREDKLKHVARIWDGFKLMGFSNQDIAAMAVMIKVCGMANHSK